MLRSPLLFLAQSRHPCLSPSHWASFEPVLVFVVCHEFECEWLLCSVPFVFGFTACAAHRLYSRRKIDKGPGRLSIQELQKKANSDEAEETQDGIVVVQDSLGLYL